MIYFDSDKYHLTPEANTTLENFYTEVKHDDYDVLKIIGHTDADGNVDYNLNLSENRTKAVSGFLVSKGLSKDKIQIQFHGESKPIASNDTKQDKRLNRRVEIIVEYNGTQLYEKDTKKAQVLSIPTDKDTTIVCAEGTVIKIKANSFVSEKTGAPVKGRVNLYVEEYYKISDILLANLSTTSNGELLETGGMLNIAATKNNEPLKLESGKTIEISFPTQRKEENMQLFSGSWIDDKHIDWTVETEEIEEEEQIYTVVEEMPMFKGGDRGLLEYIYKNMKYPPRARELNVQGKVIIGFVINENGEVKDASVLRGVSKDLDSAALAMVKTMPNWKPGRQGGRSVSVGYSIPVSFRLDNSEPKTIYNSREEFEKSYTDSTLQKARAQEVMQYVFSSDKLGWINCDRFIASPQITDFALKLGRNVEDVRIVFDRYKSVMAAFPQKGLFTFGKVPLGEKITIVALKRIDNKLYLALKKTNTTSKNEEGLDFQPVTMETLKMEMQKLDRF